MDKDDRKILICCLWAAFAAVTSYYSNLMLTVNIVVVLFVGIFDMAVNK